MMSASESNKQKHPGGRKPKYDYKSQEFLSTVESFAKKGFTDREIAFALGLNPTYFYGLKSEHSEICDVLARGRATINAAVRAKFLALAMGGVKTKSTTMRKLRDENGDLTDQEEVQTTEVELAPSLQAMSVWLYHHDEEWRKIERRQDEESDIPENIKHGVEIDSWIKDQLE